MIRVARRHRTPAPVTSACSTSSTTGREPDRPRTSWDPIWERLVESGKRFYCICFSIRSGSSVLCEDLTQLGLGAPMEQFQFPDYPVLEGPLWQHLIRLSAWAGDFFGFKISWYQATELTSRLHAEGHGSVEFDLRNVFPDLRHIWMYRRDKIGQAVSAWRAQRSGNWHWQVHTNVDAGRPQYDFEAIRTQFLQLIAEDWLWQFHFEQLQIAPLVVCYEDYINDRVGHLQRIGDYLGVRVSPSPLEDRLRVMRDDWTEEIVERFTVDLHRPF
jgi:LPS sulfotransferase NodH